MLRIVTSTGCVVLLFAALIPAPNSSALATTIDSAHSYFDALVDRPEHWKSYSLRDPGQLAPGAKGGYAHCNSCPLAVTYDPANDPYPRRQDAAKVEIPANRNSLPNQVRVPMGTADEDSYLVTWDAWFGAEYHRSNTQMTNQKSFQISSGGDRLWFEIQSRWSQGGKDGLALVTGRAYNSVTRSSEKAFGPNVTKLDPLPSVGSFVLKPERWTRYWALIDQRADDYDLTSLWVADEQTDVVQVLDRMQLNAAQGKLDSFWLEFNTSTEERPPDRGPLVAYVRNIVMLRNVVNPRSLMLRPNSGEPLPPLDRRPGPPRNLRIIPPKG
jgi:hypothetical protein